MKHHNADKKQQRIAQVPGGLATNPLGVIPAVSGLATTQMGLGTLNNAVDAVQKTVAPGEFGLPGALSAARAMGPMYLEQQSLYDLGDQYGLSRAETKSYSDMLLHNGLQIAEQAELFSGLRNIAPTLGGNFRDVLDIVTRVAIQNRAASSPDKVKKILNVLTELSREYAQNPSFNIVAMFADAARGEVQSLPVLSWIGAFTSSVFNGRDMNEYYSKINGLSSSIFAPAHDRLAIENKKAMLSEKLKREEFFFEEAAQKTAWERVYQPNFEMLTKMYHSWAGDPEEAFNLLGVDGWSAIEMLSKGLLTAGAKVSVYTKVLGLNTRSPEVSTRGGSTSPHREVYADARKNERQQEIDKLEDYNANTQGSSNPESGTQKPGTNPYLQPGTTQYQAQQDSLGQQSDAWLQMTQYLKALAPLQQRYAELEASLKLREDPRNGRYYRSIMANLKPLQDAMVAESGMKVGGGSNELSQMNSTTLLTPEIIGNTVATCGKSVEMMKAEIREYISVFQRIEELLYSFAPQDQVQKTTLQSALQQLNVAKSIVYGNAKTIQTELEKIKQALVDYHTVLPTLVKVTRLENQITLFENLREQIKAMTGNEFIGQFGMTQYNTATPDGGSKLVTGPAPSQALIALYMRVIVEFRSAISKIQSLINSGRMDKALTNAMIQRRKQIVSKIEGIKAKYTQIISASMGSVAGGAPASLERQVRLTGRITNERLASIDEQEADRIADAIIKKYFDDLLPGYGTLLENPDKHRNETVKEVREHTSKHKSKSHKNESKHKD